MSLPKDRDARNGLPIWDGCIAYFPDVWAEVAKVSVQGNKQHSLGAKLHWNTHVSTDHKNKAMRHMLDDTNGEVMDEDGTFHLAKALWRIAAALQLRIWARDGKDEHGEKVPQPKPLDLSPLALPPGGYKRAIEDWQKKQMDQPKPPVLPPFPNLPQVNISDSDFVKKVNEALAYRGPGY